VSRDLLVPSCFVGTLAVEMQAQTDTNATLRTLVSTVVSAEPVKYTGEEWPLPDGTEHPIQMGYPTERFE
jgi:hypothetical protein